MRHKYSLISLADIIGSHDKETIRRAIITASHSAELAEKKQLILEELRFSESFINEHPALAENWRTSLNCFKDLANYFMANTLIDEHEEKAMCCWYLLLNHAIPEKIKTDDNSEITNDFPYEQMIILGKAYLSEPYQFAGFVGWLLTRGVSPHIIRESKLLHYYFDYYSYNFPTLDHTYRLLKNFSEIDTNSFLDYLATSPCLSKGFINNAPVIHEFFLMSELIPMPEERNILYVKKNNNVIEYSACGMKEIGKIEPDEFAEGFSELGKSQTFDRISVIAFERGQVNRAHAEYESYNVMGTLFAHKIAFLPPQADWLIGPETAFLEKNALILLPLFGFEFIKQLLSDTTEDSSSVISILLNSPYRDIILDALPLHSLSGELNYDQTERLLTQVGLVYSHYWEKEVGDDDGESYISQQLITAETRFINLIEFNFFYIHAYGLTYLPNDAIYQATVRLCENPNSKSVHHIPFLVSLSKKLKDENLLKTHEMLIHFIVEYLMELGDMLHDDYVVELDNIFEDNVLETIKVEFQAPFERKLAEYADNIDKAINDFLSGMGDIDAIEQIASAQLSAVNLIKCLTPELLCTIKYPHGYYQLRHEIIEQYFKKNEALLPLEDSIGNLLATMSDSIEIRIRILQEFLLLSKNTDHLRKIINYVMKQDGERIPYFFHATFGYKSCVYDFIITHNDLEFKKWAFSIIPVSDSEMLDAIKRSLDNENRIAVLYLFQSFKLSAQTAFDAIVYLTNKVHSQDKYRLLLEQSILAIPEKTFSKELLGFVTQSAIEIFNENILKFICTIADKNKFPDDFANDTAIALLESKKWKMVKMFCGLTPDPVNHAVIKKNNIDLFVDVLKKRVSTALLREFYESDIMKEADCLYDEKNNLFHLAANSGCYQAVVDTFLFFEKYWFALTCSNVLHAKNELNEMPHCPAHFADAIIINEFLNKKRKKYAYETAVCPGNSPVRFLPVPLGRKRMRSGSEDTLTSESEEELARTESQEECLRLLEM